MTYKDFFFQVKMALLMEQNVELVLISYFDGLDNLTLENWSDLEKSLSISLSVIYFKMTPHIMSAIERSSYIRTLGTVNHTTHDDITEMALKNRRIIEIPDFPTVKIEKNSQWNQDEKIFAHENPVIGLFGSIDFRKNVDLFLECALSEAGSKYNWLIVGKIHYGGLRNKTCKSIKAALEGNIPNVKVISEYLSDVDFVDWYKKVDVHFLMYINWNYASNSLTNCIYNRKCAILNSDSEIFRDAASRNLGIETSNNLDGVFESIRRFQEFKISENERGKYLKINSKIEFEKKVLRLLDNINE
jgi:glycosyltransferase involved in cell wall biosynthesis